MEEKEQQTVQPMAQFFAERVEEYDAHMLEQVEGCREAYEKVAACIPQNCERLLDLGCGTGLELEKIFQKLPRVNVTGIDLCVEMLEECEKKFRGKPLSLICGNYFDVPFGEEKFDCVLSFQTMHHFLHGEKLLLYQKILKALESGGLYIECDYMAETLEQELFFLQESVRLRQEQNIPQGVLCHIDIPFAVETQTNLLKEAGFRKIEPVFRRGNTTILLSWNTEKGIHKNTPFFTKRIYKQRP